MSHWVSLTPTSKHVWAFHQLDLKVIQSWKDGPLKLLKDNAIFPMSKTGGGSGLMRGWKESYHHSYLWKIYENDVGRSPSKGGD